MRLIYVAGPFRAKTPWQVEQNVRRAEEAGLWVVYQFPNQLVPVIPHTMYRYFDGLATAQYWLDATKELLARCDAILVLANWEGSEGTRAEIDYARTHGIEDFWWGDGADRHIVKWLQGGD